MPQPLLLARASPPRPASPNASPRRVFTSQNTIVPRVAHDEIELALAHPPVAVEDRVAGAPRTRPRPRPRRLPDDAARVGHARQRSLPGSSSTFTSLKVTTRTSATKRVLRYMSHTHASRSRSSK